MRCGTSVVIVGNHTLWISQLQVVFFELIDHISSIDVKLVIFKTIFPSELMDEGKHGRVMEKHFTRIAAAEMIFLKRIVGKTKRECIRNEFTRDELDIFAVKVRIKNANMSYLW